LDFVALDFETANPARTSACALGVVSVEQGVIVKQKVWLIKPTPFYFTFSWLHGITAKEVTDSPDFSQIWYELKDMLEHRIVVAHNASFDMGVLLALLRHFDLATPKFRYFCSVQMARRTWKQLPAYNLKALSDRFGIELRHHEALSDTIACAKLVLQASNDVNTQNANDLCNTLNLKLKPF
jgi:DNA polymerase III subunit epsilon